MLPIQLAGLALAGRTLQLKYPAASNRFFSSLGKKRFILKPFTEKKYTTFRLPAPAESIRSFANGITSTLSRLKTRLIGEDLKAIAQGFLPAGVKLLNPKRPANSRGIISADLDGDMQNELIASYRYQGEIKTIILKKLNGRWEKIAETGSSGYDTLKYRGSAYITGEGRQQLLIGLSSEDKGNALYGYTLENGILSNIFIQDYHRFQVLGREKDGRRAMKAQLAVWNKRGDGTYDIQVLKWNGLELEPLEKITPYYQESVIPYYAQKVRQNPYSPYNWYNLADALAKGDVNRDALAAADIGMELDTGALLREKFLELRNRIEE